jgi:hypothetical protein
MIEKGNTMEIKKIIEKLKLEIKLIKIESIS